MINPQIERQLRKVGDQLRLLRTDLRISSEQLLKMEDAAEDARLRALVSESPMAQRQHRLSARHLERLNRHRQRVIKKIAELEATQDSLLDRLTAGPQQGHDG